MRINSNPIFTAPQNVYNVTNNLHKSTLKISSGKRINFAGEDAAGLAVGTKLTTRVNSIRQAIRNIQDGISMVQTADGGLETIASMLQRIRTLALQASNDTLTNNERSMLNDEAQELISEINRAAASVQFNTKELLTGKIDWKDWQTDIPLKNVEDVGLIDTAVFGIYEVTLDVVAVAQQQTSDAKISSHKRNTFTTAFGGDANANIVNKTSATAGGEITASGVIDFNFGETVEQLNYLKNTQTDQFLTEGVDYTYNETTNDVQLLNTAKTVYSYTATAAGGNITQNAGTQTITLDKIIENLSGINVNNINGGAAGQIYVDNVSFTNATTANSGLISGIDAVETYANIGDTQQVEVGGTLTMNLSGSITGADKIDLTALAGNLVSLSIGAGGVRQQTATVSNETISGASVYSKEVYKYTFTNSTNGTLGAITNVSIGGGVYSDNLVGSIDAVNNETDVGNYYLSGANIYTHGSSADLNSANISFKVAIANQTTAGIGSWTNEGGNLYSITLAGAYSDGFVQNSGALSNLEAGAGACDANGDYALVGNKLYFYNDGALSWDININYNANVSETINIGGNTVKEREAIYQFNVAGSNNAGTNITSASLSGSGGLFTTNEIAIFSVDAAGSYYFTNSGAVYTYGNPNAETISYQTDWDFTSLTADLANKKFTINNQTNAKNGTVSATVGDNISYKAAVTYQDGKYESIVLAGPGKRAVPNFAISSITDTLNGNLAGKYSLAANGTLTYTGPSFGFDTDITATYTYNASYTINTYNPDTATITVNNLGGNASAQKIGDVTLNNINNISYNTFYNMQATYFNMNQAPIVADNTGMSTADSLTAQQTSVVISKTGAPATIYTEGTDYTIEGKAIQIIRGGALDMNSDGVPDFDFTVDYAYGANGTNVNLDAVTQLGETFAGNADNYNTNSGLFNDFTIADDISFSVDGRIYTITVNPTDTMQDVIDNINTASQAVYENENLKPQNANMDTGNSNNVPIWAWWDGNQIVISARDENDTMGYKGSRFDISILDNQIGPGNFLNFAVTTPSIDPQITVVDPNGNSYTSVSSDGSYFFNNGSNQVAGIPGVRIKLDETASVGSKSILEILSYVLQVGPDSPEQLGLTMIDMRAGALGINNISLSTISNAQNAISKIDTALSKLSAHRATLGAIINRLDFMFNQSMVAAENTGNAASRIMDTDIAEAVVEKTKNQIMLSTNLSFVAGAQIKLGNQFLDIFNKQFGLNLRI